MAKKEKEVEPIEEIEVIEEVLVEPIHEFIVLKQFTFDKVYNPSDVFKSNANDLTNILLTNKFIK